MIPKVSLEGCCEGETTDQKNKLNSPYSMSGFFFVVFFSMWKSMAKETSLVTPQRK